MSKSAIFLSCSGGITALLRVLTSIVGSWCQWSLNPEALHSESVSLPLGHFTPTEHVINISCMLNISVYNRL